jgi:hypothetical protein
MGLRASRLLGFSDEGFHDRLIVKGATKHHAVSYVGAYPMMYNERGLLDLSTKKALKRRSVKTY